jgi:hypothetical protein
MLHPREFIAEYVDPAIELYRKNRTVKHLAVHAMTQVDVLAAVVGLWSAGCQKLEESQFREELGRREPAIALIRDAHDSHKHGRLRRKSAAAASQGQRPERVTKHAHFLNRFFFGKLPIAYDVLVLVLNDGTEKEVYSLLHEAMQAWNRELSRRRL